MSGQVNAAHAFMLVGSVVVKVGLAKQECPCQNACWQMLHCLGIFGEARQLQSYNTFALCQQTKPACSDHVEHAQAC